MSDVVYEVVDWDAVYAPLSEQERVNRIRVRGYALACCERVSRAHEELERMVTLLQRARVDADRALAHLRGELDHAEAMSRVVVLDDPETNERLALALERLEDVE